MSSAKRGNEAEAKVLSALVERGFEVAVPFGSGQPYDLLVDLGGRDFLRVQCKRAWSLQGCIVFNCRSTDHGRGPQSYAGLADIFGVYFPPNSIVYLVPLDSIAEFASAEQPASEDPSRFGIRDRPVDSRGSPKPTAPGLG